MTYVFLVLIVFGLCVSFKAIAAGYLQYNAIAMIGQL